MKNVLVVGGAGYIGSHQCKLLVERGFSVTNLDDLSTGHEYATAYGTFYKGSASDRALVERILKKHNIDTVMHFAAKALVGESVANPMLYYKNNVVETFSLIETMLFNNVVNFIFSSTCSTYGEPKLTPILEDSAQNPINPYGRSKLIVEMILRDLCLSHGLNSAVLRYFNAAGADPEGKLGENHKVETHLIPLALQSAIKNDGKLKVYGDDYPTPDGTCIRDYIHILDLCDAHIKAGEFLKTTRGFHDFNLGSEKGFSVLEIISSIEKTIGSKVKYSVSSRREGDPPVLVGDSSKAKRILNWKPKYSIDQIIKTAYEWEKNKP